MKFGYTRSWVEPLSFLLFGLKIYYLVCQHELSTIHSLMLLLTCTDGPKMVVKAPGFCHSDQHGGIPNEPEKYFYHLLFPSHNTS